MADSQPTTQMDLPQIQSAFVNARADAQELAQEDAVAAAANVDAPDSLTISGASVFDSATSGDAIEHDDWARLGKEDAQDVPSGDAGATTVMAATVVPSATPLAEVELAGSENPRIQRPLRVRNRSISAEERVGNDEFHKIPLAEAGVTAAVVIAGVALILSRSCSK